MILIGVVVASVLIAIWFDWKERRIPNRLTLSMAALGLILNFWMQGISGLTHSLYGLGCGLLLLILPFAVGGVGGGDVKLMGAIGSIVGPMLVLKIFLASAVFGGILSLATMIRRKALGATLRGIRDRIIYMVLTKKAPDENQWKREKEVSVPYAVAIGCGTLFVLFAL